MRTLLLSVLMFLSSVAYAAPEPFGYYESYEEGDKQNFMVLASEGLSPIFQIYLYDEFTSDEIQKGYVYADVRITDYYGRETRYNSVPFLLTDDIRGMIVGNVPSDDHFMNDEEQERYAKHVHLMIVKQMLLRNGKVYLLIRSDAGAKKIEFPCDK